MGREITLLTVKRPVISIFGMLYIPTVPFLREFLVAKRVTKAVFFFSKAFKTRQGFLAISHRFFIFISQVKQQKRLQRLITGTILWPLKNDFGDRTNPRFRRMPVVRFKSCRRTTEMKSNEEWFSQLWTQFMQLRKKAGITPLKSWIFFSHLTQLRLKLRSQLRESFLIWFHFRKSYMIYFIYISQ